MAEGTAHLMVTVPQQTDPGPTEVEVVGPDWTHKFPKVEFTVMAPAPLVPQQNGLFKVKNYEASVTEDGTLLIPFNLSGVEIGTQFLVLLEGLPLSFAHDDIVFYNADAVDLTLFTLQVEDPTVRQWGSYYGWDVEQDKGFTRTVYKKKIMKWLGLEFSDQLTYWRHEFQTYKAAHQAGGSHEVDPHGYHVSDGTLHIDHDHLVLAVSGKVRDGNKPAEEWDALSPGSETVDVYVLTAASDGPIEPHEMMGSFTHSVGQGLVTLMLAEPPNAYDHNDD